VLVFGELLNAGEDKVARQHHGHDDDQFYLSQPSY
jgi:hypothetical protein